MMLPGTSLCAQVCLHVKRLLLQAATVVSSGIGDVSSTSSLPEPAATEPQAQPLMIALEVVFFYLHEAFEAARGWGRELKHAGQVLSPCMHDTASHYLQYNVEASHSTECTVLWQASGAFFMQFKVWLLVLHVGTAPALWLALTDVTEHVVFG